MITIFNLRVNYNYNTLGISNIMLMRYAYFWDFDRRLFINCNTKKSAYKNTFLQIYKNEYALKQIIDT